MSAAEPLRASRQASYDSTLGVGPLDGPRRRESASNAAKRSSQSSAATSSANITEYSPTAIAADVTSGPSAPAPAPPSAPAPPPAKDPVPHIGWKESFGAFQFHAIALENKGSVARDHLANERTFLAWLRTSLSFITIGIGVTQLFRLDSKTATENTSGHSEINKYGKPLGGTFIALGIVTLLLGVVRFFQVQFLLTKNYFPASRLSMVVLILVVLAVVVATFAMVIRASS